jgi:hypothetical protein
MAEDRVVIVRFTEAGGGTRRPPVLSAVIVSGNVLGDLWDWVVGACQSLGLKPDTGLCP